MHTRELPKNNWRTRPIRDTYTPLTRHLYSTDAQPIVVYRSYKLEPATRDEIRQLTKHKILFEKSILGLCWRNARVFFLYSENYLNIHGRLVSFTQVEFRWTSGDENYFSLKSVLGHIQSRCHVLLICILHFIKKCVQFELYVWYYAMLQVMNTPPPHPRLCFRTRNRPPLFRSGEL